MKYVFDKDKQQLVEKQEPKSTIELIVPNSFPSEAFKFFFELTEDFQDIMAGKEPRHRK